MDSSKILLKTDSKNLTRHLQWIEELRENATNCILEGTNEMNGIIGRVENAIDLTDNSKLELLSNELSFASSLVDNYVDALEKIKCINENAASLFPIEKGQSEVRDHVENLDCNTSPDTGRFAISDLSSGISSPVEDTSVIEEDNPLELRDVSLINSHPAATAAILEFDGSKLDCSVSNPAWPTNESGNSSSFDDWPIGNRVDDEMDNTSGSSATKPKPKSSSRVCRGFIEASSSGASSTSTSSSSSYITNWMDDLHQYSNIVPPPQLRITVAGLIRFNICEVVSPDDFYIRQCPMSDSDPEQYWLLRSDMQRFYSKPGRRSRLFLHLVLDIQQFMGIFGAVNFSSDDMQDWPVARCQVLGWKSRSDSSDIVEDTEDLVAEVLYIDLGKKGVVEPLHIWKLEERFCHLPALSIRCKLFDILPCGGFWSEEALAKFKNMIAAVDPVLIGRIVNRQQPYKLIGYIYCGFMRRCLNETLVRSKIAKSLTDWNRVSKVMEVITRPSPTPSNMRRSP